jgi:PAS domain S-box-containing protein
LPRVRLLTALRAAIAAGRASLREPVSVAQDRRGGAEALLDVMFERTPVGLAYIDSDLRVARVNDALAALIGIPADAQVGRCVRELLPDLPAEVDADLVRVLRTGEPLTEVQVRGATRAQPGTPREWLVSYWPVHAEGGATVTGVGCAVFDVTERRRAQRELRRQTDRYEALLLALSEAGEGMLVIEEDGRCVYVNGAFEHLSGYAAPELTALESVFELVVPEQRDEVRRRVLLRVERGIVEDGYLLTLRRRDGTLIDLEVVGVPLAVEHGHRIVVIAHDVTERRRVEVARERLLARSALMAEASELFDQSLDEAATLERVARLCVRDLASTCIVVLGDAPGAIRRVAAAARDPEVERTLLELHLRYPLDEDPANVIFDVLRSGESLVLDPIHDLVDELEDPHHRDLVRALGMEVGMIVPLRARGTARGVLALGFPSLACQDRDELLDRFEDLGRRAALALDTVRLYEERTTVARTLQRSLLPPALPDVPGLEIAARYLAAGEGNELGGDFYDCFATGDGEWAVVIGDVCGKGAEAAALTALARHTLRASAMHDRRPAAVLHELNAAILRHGTDYRFCTAVYVALRPGDEGVEARVSTGGHPLPLLLRADGRVEVAGRTGTLLGVLADPELSETSLALRPGDALVLFTDGVIEASPLDDAFGPARLAAFLGDCAGLDATRIAAGVERRVLEVQSGHLRDDVAVVVLRVSPRASAPFVPVAQGVAARS